MKIDRQVIEAELNKLANPGPDLVEQLKGKASRISRVKVEVKLDKDMDVATSIRETDDGYHIRLNPSRFKSEKKLANHLNECREAVTK